MSTGKNNNERIRRAVEGSTPPLRPGVRKRALWAAMAGLRRRSPLRTVIVMVLVLLLLAALVYVAARCFSSVGNWLR